MNWVYLGSSGRAWVGWGEQGGAWAASSWPGWCSQFSQFAAGQAQQKLSQQQAQPCPPLQEKVGARSLPTAAGLCVFPTSWRSPFAKRLRKAQDMPAWELGMLRGLPSGYHPQQEEEEEGIGIHSAALSLTSPHRFVPI